MKYKIKYKVKDNTIIRELEGHAFVLHGDNDYISTLSLSGTLILKILQDEQEIYYEDLLSKILSEYDVERDIADRDLKEFLINLENKGLIE